MLARDEGENHVGPSAGLKDCYPTWRVLALFMHVGKLAYHLRKMKIFDTRYEELKKGEGE